MTEILSSIMGVFDFITGLALIFGLGGLWHFLGVAMIGKGVISFI